MAESEQIGTLPEVFQLIEATGRQLKRLQALTLRDSGLTPPQYFIMTRLWEQDGRVFKDLADLLNCSRATITEIVDSLERKELVARAPNPSDRRSQLVKLTARGEALRETTQGLQEAFHSCCFDLEPEEAMQLNVLLKKLHRALQF